MDVPTASRLTPQGKSAWGELLKRYPDRLHVTLEEEFALKYTAGADQKDRRLVIPAGTDVAMFCRLPGFGNENPGAPEVLTEATFYAPGGFVSIMSDSSVKIPDGYDAPTVVTEEGLLIYLIGRLELE